MAQCFFPVFLCIVKQRKTKTELTTQTETSDIGYPVVVMVSSREDPGFGSLTSAGCSALSSARSTSWMPDESTFVGFGR